MGNMANVIHHLFDPHPSDFKNNNRTINCGEDDSRIRFDYVDMDGNSDESGEDDGRIRFDDGYTDSLEEVAELEEEFMAYKVAQLKIKLAERGLIQTERKPELIKRLLNP